MNILAILPKGFKTEMIFSVTKEAKLFFCSVVIGILFGIGYEALRLLRRTVRHNDTAVFIEDFLFVIVCAFWYFVFVHASAWGQIRLFIFIGMALGMALEQLTFGELFVDSLALVISRISGRVIFPLLKLLAHPFVSIVRSTINIWAKFVQSSKVLRKNKKQAENA